MSPVSPVSDQDQTFFLPRQSETADDPPAHSPHEETAGGGVTVDTDTDHTVVIPKVVADDTKAQDRPSEWDAEPRARGVMAIEGSPLGRQRALGTLAWVVAMVATGSLALIRLNWSSLRVAELSAWGFTRTPKAVVFQLLHEVGAADAPYFLLLKGWAKVFGRSDFALRVPSVIAMAVAAALIAALGTRLGGPRVGLLAGLMTAALPVTTRYAQEVGPQALTMCGAALATLTLVVYLDRPKAWQLAGYTAALALTGVSHLTGLLIVLAHGIVVLVMKRRLLFGWLVASVVGAAPTVALVVLFGAPLRTSSDAAVVSLPSIAQLSQDAFGPILAAGLVVGLAILALSIRKPAVVFTTWAIVPLALLYPVMRFTTFGADRMAIIALFGWVGLAALGLSRALVVRGLAVVLAIAAIGIPDHVAIRRPDGHGQATHELANVLFSQGKPGDAIVYGPADEDGPAGRDIVERYLSETRRPKDILATSIPRFDGHLRATECPDVDACLGKTTRVWLVRVGSMDSPLTGLEAGKDGALRVRYAVTQTWHLTGLTLTLFTLKSNA